MFRHPSRKQAFVLESHRWGAQSKFRFQSQILRERGRLFPSRFSPVRYVLSATPLLFAVHTRGHVAGGHSFPPLPATARAARALTIVARRVQQYIGATERQILTRKLATAVGSLHCSTDKYLHRTCSSRGVRWGKLAQAPEGRGSSSQCCCCSDGSN